jgi:hypothetical protein
MPPQTRSQRKTRPAKTHNMQQSESKQLVSLLNELRGAVEELLLAGLTAASKSTVERIDVSFKEASRMRLLRLGSTLRIANEEISRFTTGSVQFSPRRLAFFLGRAWLLATSMRRAIDANDGTTLDSLMSTPPTQPVPSLKCVTLGVTKRVVSGAFASFDFRLRAIEASAPVAAGEALVWSCVFPMRKDLDLPAEAFLHLPQKQKFKPSLLLERKIVEVFRCAVSRQPNSAARLVLGDASEMKATAAFTDWSSFWKWDLAAASARLEQHRPTPLDLEIELQEEVFIDEWEAGERQSTEQGYDLLPIRAGHLQFEARLDLGPSGTPLHSVMTKLAEKKRKPGLYGVVHYESCKLVLQPLAALGKEGPEYLTVSPGKINQAELIKAMKFT